MKVTETLLYVGSGRPFLKLILDENIVEKYRGKKLTWQQIFDLSPLAECRCRILNGMIADMCLGHYYTLTYEQKILADRMMKEIQLGR